MRLKFFVKQYLPQNRDTVWHSCKKHWCVCVTTLTYAAADSRQKASGFGPMHLMLFSHAEYKRRLNYESTSLLSQFQEIESFSSNRIPTPYSSVYLNILRRYFKPILTKYFVNHANCEIYLKITTKQNI